MAAPFNAVDMDTISKATPYIRRIIQDAQLRENVKTAFDSSRSAYTRLSTEPPGRGGEWAEEPAPLTWPADTTAPNR